MEKVFLYIGILTCSIIFILACAGAVYAFVIWFRKWRKHNCKFKCLCKHTYKIHWIARNEEMAIECINCGQHKVLNFDKKTLKAFMR